MATTARKPSAYVLIPLVSVVYVVVVEAYVPTVTLEEKSWKKGSEIDVTLSDP